MNEELDDGNINKLSKYKMDYIFKIWQFNKDSGNN